MKYLLSALCLLVMYSVEAKTVTVIKDVKDMDLAGGEFLIKFDADANVYRLSENHSTIPCLNNGWLSGMKVALQMDEQAKLIKGCKLASGPLPGMMQSQQIR